MLSAFYVTPLHRWATLLRLTMEFLFKTLGRGLTIFSWLFLRNSCQFTFWEFTSFLIDFTGLQSLFFRLTDNEKYIFSFLIPYAEKWNYKHLLSPLLIPFPWFLRSYFFVSYLPSMHFKKMFVIQPQPIFFYLFFSVFHHSSHDIEWGIFLKLLQCLLDFLKKKKNKNTLICRDCVSLRQILT